MEWWVDRGERKKRGCVFSERQCREERESIRGVWV